jgi:hypothetical protein
MNRLIVCLILTLSACSVPQEKGTVQEAPALLEPSAMEAMVLRCAPDAIGAQDGIGGTGCNAPQVR